MQRMIRRTAVVALTMVGVQTTALADQWSKITENAAGVFEFDLNSIQTRDGWLSAWVRTSYASKQPYKEGLMYRSVSELDAYNCKMGSFAPIQRVEYEGVSATGKVLGMDNLLGYPPIPRWLFPPPESDMAKAFALVCEDKSSQ
jgi:hypothetical protein